jgi:hypothetical protein
VEREDETLVSLPVEHIVTPDMKERDRLERRLSGAFGK